MMRTAVWVVVVSIATATAAHASACREVSFHETPSFHAGDRIMAVVAGDFNGDGIDDLIVGNGGSTIIFGRAPGLAVWENDGHAHFTKRVVISDSIYVQQIVVGDFDGDHALDAMILESDTNNLITFLNRGDHFVEAGRTQLSTELLDASFAIKVGDVNGDGHADVIANRQNAMTILLGRGDGTFDVQPFVAPEGAMVLFAFADLDHDGRLDVVYGARGNIGHVIIRHGTASGTFGPPRTFDLPYPVLSGGFVLGDFDGDGKVDLLAAERQLVRDVEHSSNTVVASTDANYFGIGGTADLNGDGRTDLIGSRLDVKAFDGSAFKFVSPQHFALTFRGIGDFNHDGLPDLITTDPNNVSVVLNLGNFKFDAPEVVGRRPVAVVDVNGDGIMDLINSYGATVSFGNADGTYRDGPFEFVQTDNARWAFAVADVTSDGQPDVIALDKIGTNNRGLLTLLAGHPDGSFSPRPLGQLGYRPNELVLADLDGDGHLDAIAGNTTNFDGPGVMVAWGNGDGFDPAVGLPVSTAGEFISVGDIDGDGRLDLLVNEYHHQTVCFNKGGRSFAIVPQDRDFDIPQRLADLNEDGKADLVTFDGRRVSVKLGKGDGTFALSQTVDLGTQGPLSLAVADMNGDGHIDVVAAALTSDTAAAFFVLLGDGHGVLGAPASWRSSGAVRIFDFNKDGRPDVLHDSFVRLNTCTPSVPKRRAIGTH